MAKKQSFRSRFTDNYTTVTVPANNRRGYKIQYVYYAPWYIWKVTEEEFKKKRRNIVIFEILGLLLFLASVLLRAPVNSVKIIFVPTALIACAQILELAALLDFCMAKIKTTKMQYQNITRGLVAFPSIRAFLLIVATVLSLGYLLFFDLSFATAQVVILDLCCIPLAWQVQNTYKSMKFTTEENNIMDWVVEMEEKVAEIQRQKKEANHD